MIRSRSAFLSAVVDKYGLSLLAYGGVSGVSALTEWGSFFALFPFIGAIWAALAGFFIATVVNYLLSHYFVFRTIRSFFQEIVLIVGMSAVVFAANFLIFYLLYAVANFAPLHAKIIGTCFGFAFNYAIRQFFIFSRIPLFAPISALYRRRPRTDDTNDGATISAYAGNARLSPRSQARSMDTK